MVREIGLCKFDHSGFLVIAMSITEMAAFKAVVDDNRLLECAVLDLIDIIAQRMISGRPVADALILLDCLRAQIEKGPSK